MFLMAVSLPMFVRALSYLDYQLQPREYVKTWMLALLMVALVIVSAGVDAMNNVRLHQQQRRQELDKTATDLASAIAQRRAASRPSRPPDAEHSE